MVLLCNFALLHIRLACYVSGYLEEQAGTDQVFTVMGIVQLVAFAVGIVDLIIWKCNRKHKVYNLEMTN